VIVYSAAAWPVGTTAPLAFPVDTNGSRALCGNFTGNLTGKIAVVGALGSPNACVNKVLQTVVNAGAVGLILYGPGFRPYAVNINAYPIPYGTVYAEDAEKLAGYV
jgi:hypothetical protein